MITGTRIDQPILGGFKSSDAFFKGLHDSSKGNMLSLPFMAFEVSTAQKGEQLTTAAAGTATTFFTYPALTAFTASALALIPGVNIAAAGFIAGIAAMYPNSYLQKSAIRRLNWLNQTGKNIRHAEFGSKYFDTDYAKNLRQIHMQELSSAIQPARRLLGQEAIFRHR